MKTLKKVLAFVLVLSMTLLLGACTGTGSSTTTTASEGTTLTVPTTLKIGIILLHDTNVGYDAAHIAGIKAAATAIGIPDSQIIWKYSVPESDKCADAIADLIEQGCNYIFSDSYGHQTYMMAAAKENTKVNFVAMTGDQAAPSGLTNISNAFTKVYESRYVSGVVAGLKLKELMDAGTVTDPKVGYVGAFPYAEVVSGYTAFFLGIRSIVPTATMMVQYTNSWADSTAEATAANALIAKGCVIIGQHADTEGAPQACETALESGKTVYSVGYNVSMLTAAPKAALTSATNNWSVYYTYAFTQAVNGAKIDTDWAKGYTDGAVAITALGDSCASGTADKVADVEAKLKAGTLNVFDTSTFTVDNKAITTFTFDSTITNFSTGDVIYQGTKSEAIKDGAFLESYYRSAPYFNLIIDGITVLS